MRVIKYVLFLYFKTYENTSPITRDLCHGALVPQHNYNTAYPVKKWFPITLQVNWYGIKSHYEVFQCICDLGPFTITSHVP